MFRFFHKKVVFNNELLFVSYITRKQKFVKVFSIIYGLLNSFFAWAMLIEKGVFVFIGNVNRCVRVNRCEYLRYLAKK